MKAVSDPPPLVPDSPAARLLFQVWSGKRIVLGPPLIPFEQETEAISLIVAHLHRRADFSVLVYDEADDFYEAGNPSPLDLIRRYVTEESIVLADKHREPSGSPVVYVAHKPDHLPRVIVHYGFQLVIMTTPQDPHLTVGHCLVAGDQLLSFDREDEVVLADRIGLIVPSDVALAGGVEE